MEAENISAPKKKKNCPTATRNPAMTTPRLNPGVHRQKLDTNYMPSIIPDNLLMTWYILKLFITYSHTITLLIILFVLCFSSFFTGLQDHSCIILNGIYILIQPINIVWSSCNSRMKPGTIRIL